MASLIGIKGKGLITERKTLLGEMEGERADRDQLHFAEVMLDRIPSGNQDSADAVRPILNQLARSAGLSLPPSFDTSGNYLLKF